MNALTPTNPAGALVPAFSQRLFNSFISYLDASKKSIETYTRALRPFFTYCGENGITRPQRADVLAYRDALKGTNKSASTVQLYITVVRLFFRWTAQNGLYPDVAEHVKGAKVDRSHKKDALTGAQARDILRVSGKNISTEAGARDYALVSLMMATGIRTIEAVRADIGDLRARAGETVLFIQGKGHDDKADWVKVPQAVEKAIRNYISLRGTYARDTEPLFASVSPRDYGGRMTTRSISRIVKNSFIKAGYKSSRLTAHSTRHTAVTMALQAGRSLEEVKDFARHVSIATTLIYAHDMSAGAAKDACGDAIAAQLFGSADGSLEK